MLRTFESVSLRDIKLQGNNSETGGTSSRPFDLFWSGFTCRRERYISGLTIWPQTHLTVTIISECRTPGISGQEFSQNCTFFVKVKAVFLEAKKVKGTNCLFRNSLNLKSKCYAIKTLCVQTSMKTRLSVQNTLLIHKLKTAVSPPISTTNKTEYLYLIRIFLFSYKIT